MFFIFLGKVMPHWRAGIYFEDAVYTNCNLFAIFLSFEIHRLILCIHEKHWATQNKILHFEIRIFLPGSRRVNGEFFISRIKPDT